MGKSDNKRFFYHAISKASKSESLLSDVSLFVNEQNHRKHFSPCRLTLRQDRHADKQRWIATKWYAHASIFKRTNTWTWFFGVCGLFGGCGCKRVEWGAAHEEWDAVVSGIWFPFRTTQVAVGHGHRYMLSLHAIPYAKQTNVRFCPFFFHNCCLQGCGS